MRTFTLGLLVGVGLTVGGAIALDWKTDAKQKVVNWTVLSQKAVAFTPAHLLR